MKKNKTKKILLLSLTALTLMTASATSIVSSVIDNQAPVVSRIRKNAVPAGRTLVGQFSVKVSKSATANGYQGILDISELSSVQLGGKNNFAVVIVSSDEQVISYLEQDCSNIYPSLTSTSASEFYSLSSNGMHALVCIFKDIGTKDVSTFSFNFEYSQVFDRERADLEMESICEEGVYGGYFGSSSDAIITAANIPGLSDSDTVGPLISGSQKTYTTSVDSPISVETIKSALTASDETDGDVTSSIVIKSDNYTENKNKLGSYDIVFEASDKTGNKATLTVTVVVQDLVSPTIIGNDSHSFSYTAAKTLDDIKALYSVTDNYDTSLSIAVDSQSPTFDGTKVGTYTLVLSATDTSGHKVTKNVTVNIIDDVAPVFSGSTSVVSNNATGLTLSEVKTRCEIIATDAIDGAVDVTIKSETLTGNANKVGNYEVIYQATDASGNTAEFKVSISIVDNIPPVFYIDESIIYAANNISMTSVDLCNLMVATCEIDASKAYSLTIDDTDGYLEACATGEEVPVGDYSVTAKVHYADGNEDVYVKTISVYDPDIADIEYEEVKLNFFEAIGQFFKNWKASWDEGGFKLWWQKLWNGDLFKENMTKIVEVEKDIPVDSASSEQ